MARILAVMTNRGRYEARPKPTGLWLAELTHFLDRVEPAGHEVSFASPAGGAVPLDPRSLGRLFASARDHARREDPTFARALAETPALSEVDPEGFDAVYFTGGHGTMFDFPGSPDIAPLCTSIYERRGVVASVCHGVGAMLALDTPGARGLIEGREITGYSDLEEKLAGVARLVPFSLESELRRLGARYSKAKLPFASHVKVDGRLVTGQNPQSTGAVADATVRLLSGR